MHLLIADDLHDNAETLAALLTGHAGVEIVDVAFDGQQAVESAWAHCPDVAILDIEMPRLGGVDAARVIQLQAKGHEPVLIAMTGSADSEEAARLTGVFAAVLLKPVCHQQLLAILQMTAERLAADRHH